MGEARRKAQFAEDQEAKRLEAEAQKADEARRQRENIVEMAQIIYSLRLRVGRRDDHDLKSEAEFALKAADTFASVAASVK